MVLRSGRIRDSRDGGRLNLCPSDLSRFGPDDAVIRSTDVTPSLNLRPAQDPNIRAGLVSGGHVTRRTSLSPHSIRRLSVSGVCSVSGISWRGSSWHRVAPAKDAESGTEPCTRSKGVGCEAPRSCHPGPRVRRGVVGTPGVPHRDRRRAALPLSRLAMPSSRHG